VLTGNSVTAPDVVIRPMAAVSVNQSAQSGPAMINPGLPPEGIGNSVTSSSSSATTTSCVSEHIVRFLQKKPSPERSP
jgi:hypothetical protein